MESRFDLAYNAAHAVRNRCEYEGDLSIDERLLTELIKACRTVLESLQKLPPI